ncbi:FecCD family ABC transporter permease [Anaerosacchariphilus polymeriproducens]|uniref:Iron ABC transporter permease n=1 Tax=Anaerosacchariphilus polymeriproducens TaxID=1812858 RepID=A0A371AZZ3_9FIRM|nr:iron ABC transporter permease [Anaerosacchariphilus polymeriproducens]RDU25119.1 iron ABC transporter permease [Anaerosacchariphilus polymeriproducens]
MKHKKTIKEYKNFIKNKNMIIGIMFLFVLLLAFAALSTGTSDMNGFDVLKTFFGGGTKKSQIILFGMRLPRILTAIFVGSALAIAGAVMQSALRNPLASASTLGVLQGSAFGAAVGIIVFGAGIQSSASIDSAVVINNPYIVTFCAFIGGFIPTFIILTVSRIKSFGPEALILAGVALSTLFNAGLTLLQYFASDVQLAAVVFWTFGDIGRTSKNEVIMIAVFTIAALVYFMFNRWNYNAINSGINTAKSLGVDVDKTILISMAVCSLISAFGVAFVGIISFVGVIAPHVMKFFIGNDYRYLLPASALCGALILLAADIFGRLIVAPVILPIGAVTSLLGAPVFLYLVFKGVKK